MFKIVRTAKQIFSAARNLGQKASVSISSGLKYCTQSKGYVEDASGEFTFEKVVPNQSLTQDKMNSFKTVCPNIAKPQSIDWHAIRKLIYARFADEIVAKPKNVVDTKSHETKEYVGDVVATYNIADEFNALREQGYDFASARKAIENQNVRSLSQRMKELVVSGYMSSYSGESGLKEEVEKVMHQKALVIEEFMQRLTGELEEYSIELLG